MSPQPHVRTKPVETDEELRVANGLMAAVHASDDVEARNWLFDLGARYPGYRREHTRIAKLGDEIVSALRISTDTMAIGESRLKLGGIGWVATAPNRRRMGFCRVLMQDAMDYLVRHGYHVSVLFGIPDFYHRFGFTSTLAEHTVSMDTVEATTFHSTLRLREARAAEAPILQRLHAQCNGAAPGSLVRSAAHFVNRWNSWKTWYVLADADGSPEAYFIARPEGACMRIDDVGMAEPGLAAAVVAAAGALASEASLGQVRFYAPPLHPLARYLLQFRSRHETAFERDAGGMMAFNNLPETLECMIPEWESLLAASIAHESRTEATLIVAGRPHCVRCHRGAIDVIPQTGMNKVSLDQGQLMQLMMGYIHVDDVLAARRALVSTEARLFLRSIFPKRSPYFWPFDRF